MDTFTDACDQMPDDDLDLKKCESTVTMDASHLDTSKVSLDPKFLVRWQNLKVSVPSKHGPRLVLNEVSGQVDNQQITAILGPSGAGKSTLLNCISGNHSKKYAIITITTIKTNSQRYYATFQIVIKFNSIMII